MTNTSVADAKNNLPKLLHSVESGAAVHITRRGKPVAVLLSEAEYARLTAQPSRRGFWEHIVDMRNAPDFEPLTLTVEDINDWRDRSPGRDVQWPD